MHRSPRLIIIHTLGICSAPIASEADAHACATHLERDTERKGHCEASSGDEKTSGRQLERSPEQIDARMTSDGLNDIRSRNEINQRAGLGVKMNHRQVASRPRSQMEEGGCSRHEHDLRQKGD